MTRAAAAAALAVLIGGEIVVGGPLGLLHPWRLLWPFLFLFVGLELAARRRSPGAGLAFDLGAAFALLYEGAFAKTVHDGLGPLGLSVPALFGALFDWAMLAVVARHAAQWLVPRKEGEPAFPETSAKLLLAAAFSLAFLVYCVRNWFGHHRAERMLGPEWLAADLLLVGLGAWWARSALSESRDPGAPSKAAYALCALGCWWPLADRLAAAARLELLPGPVVFLSLLAWTMVCGFAAWVFWRDRAYYDETPVASHRVVLGAAAWRFAGSVALWAWFGALPADPRAPVFAALVVDLPFRIAASYAFLTSRPRD